MNPSSRRLLVLFLVFLICFLGVSLLRNAGSEGLLGSLFQKKQDFRPEPFTLADTPPLDPGEVGLLNRLNQEYAKLTKAVVPSVVSIDTTGVRTQRMLDFWGRTRIRQYPTQGQGSGAIVTHEGHIVTNHHVIAGQQQIRVTLNDGRTLNARLIGEDPLLDIAILKIDAKENFIPLKLGDSSEVEVGQMVFAIGNPFGLGETVTQGIISAKERSLSDKQRDLFQTDAAINPGNSGGPLVNLRGEIIGINVAIFSSDRENPGYQGVGFSIPANDVRDVLTQILERGRPIRGFLGVQTRDLNSLILDQFDLPADQKGALVLGVSPNSPAEQSGLKKLDIITSFDGNEIRSATQLLNLVQSSTVGELVKIQILRDRKALELEAKLLEAGSEVVTPQPEPDASNTEMVLRAIGLEVRDLTVRENIRGYRGVVVTKITSNSLSAPELAVGDLIVKLNGSTIQGAHQFFLELASSVPQRQTSLLVYRNGRRMNLTLPSLSRVD